MNKEPSKDTIKMIANPRFIINTISEEICISYSDKLKRVLQANYTDIYVNDTFIKKIQECIDHEVQNARDDRAVLECVNTLVDKCIDANTFSFLQKFD